MDLPPDCGGNLRFPSISNSRGCTESVGGALGAAMPMRMSFHAPMGQLRRPSVPKRERTPPKSYVAPRSPSPSFSRHRITEAVGKPDPKALLEHQCGTLSLHAGTSHPMELRLALERGEHANARDADGDRTALHWAAARGHCECCLLLLMHGADPLVADGAGRTPAHLAFDLRQTDVVRVLDGWAESRNLHDPARATRTAQAAQAERGAASGAEPPPRATGGPTPSSSPFSTPPSDRHKKR